VTQVDFLAMLETDLALRGVAFDRAELLAYVASMWPWIETTPTPAAGPGSF
jgi:hypothetical protein